MVPTYYYVGQNCTSVELMPSSLTSSDPFVGVDVGVGVGGCHVIGCGGCVWVWPVSESSAGVGVGVPVIRVISLS